MSPEAEKLAMTAIAMAVVASDSGGWCDEHPWSASNPFWALVGAEMARSGGAMEHGGGEEARLGA